MLKRQAAFYNAKALNCPLKPSFNCDLPEIPHLASHGDSAMSWWPCSEMSYKYVKIPYDTFIATELSCLTQPFG